MQPGLYCVSNDFTVNGGVLTGQDVTIYLSVEHADFSTSGAAEVHLDAPEPECEAELPANGGCYPALGGMLLYVQHGDVSLLGNSASYYEGTVYAPEGEIGVGGGSSEMSNIGAQLIGNTVKLHGDTLLDILYDNSVVYHNGPRVSLTE